jgi:hypothetical protein
MVEMDSRQKAEEFIRLKKKNTVLPPDDVNLPHDLFTQRAQRKLGRNLNDNEFLLQMRNLLMDAPISDFLKQQIVFESGLEEAVGWTRWGEDQEKLAEESVGISLAENKYGIFDPNLSLAAETMYFAKILPFLEIRDKSGIFNPVSYREWSKDLLKRIIKEK